MDPITTTIVFKGLGMFVALIGGIVVARYGYSLFKDGAGHGREQIGFKMGKVEAKAQSVGSVCMASAFMWGVIAVQLAPSFAKDGNAVKVYSMTTPVGDLQASAIATLTKIDAADLKSSDPAAIKALERALQAGLQDKPTGVRLNGRPASVDALGIRAVSTPNGIKFMTTVKSTESQVDLVYKPVAEQGKLLFVPSPA